MMCHGSCCKVVSDGGRDTLLSNYDREWQAPSAHHITCYCNVKYNYYGRVRIVLCRVKRVVALRVQQRVLVKVRREPTSFGYMRNKKSTRYYYYYYYYTTVVLILLLYVADHVLFEDG